MMAFLIYICILVIFVEVNTNNDNENTNVMRINIKNYLKSSSENNKSKPDYNDTKAFVEKGFLGLDINKSSEAVDLLPRETCRNDSKLVLKSAIGRESWALKVFDSSSKLPVGMLFGSHYQLGNFDECISVKKTLTPDKMFLGKYCMVDVTIDNENERVIRSDNLKHDLVSSRNVFNNTMHWGLCVPSSCGSKDVETLFNGLLNTYTSYPILATQVDPINCYYKKDTPYTVLEIIFGCFMGIFVVFIVLATIYHLICIYGQSRKIYRLNQVKLEIGIYQEIVLSFSLVRNVSKLFNLKTSDTSLDCIFGIRFLSMSFIILSHSLLFIISGPILNKDFYIEAVQKPQNAILLSHPLLVDTFLLLSGFLMCRILLVELDKRNGKINFAVVYLARYLRLTPSYFIVIALYSTVLVKLDDGPFWNKVISTEQMRCKISWWTNLLYINNYVNTDNICMFQSWYLAADTQLFVIAPIIIYPLWKWRRIGEIILGLLTFITITIPFTVTFIYGLDPTLMSFPLESSDITRNLYFVFAYIKTHMRAIAYFIGLVAGYIVHKLHSSNIKLSKGLVRFSWALSTILGLSAIFSITVFYLPHYEFSPIASAVYSSLHKVAWSVSIGWIIIACVTNNSGPIRKFLSWAPFIPLGRLTYCAYLVNGLIEIYAIGTQRSAVFMSIYSIAEVAIAHFVLTFAAGFILSIMFESPLLNLEKLILRGTTQISQKTDTAK